MRFSHDGNNKWTEFVEGKWIPAEIAPMQNTLKDEGIRSLPMEIVKEAYEEYHERYPGQTLERLNQRGGFSDGEIIMFLFDRIKRLKGKNK